MIARAGALVLVIVIVFIAVAAVLMVVISGDQRIPLRNLTDRELDVLREVATSRWMVCHDDRFDEISQALTDEICRRVAAGKMEQYSFPTIDADAEAFADFYMPARLEVRP